MQSKEFIASAVNILSQIDALNEELKELKSAAKESELDVASLVAAAKAIVSNKCDELIEKSEAIIEAVNLARS